MAVIGQHSWVTMHCYPAWTLTNDCYYQSGLMNFQFLYNKSLKDWSLRKQYS